MKKNSIGRTLFWFKDGGVTLRGLNDYYFSLGTLLNRLLNEQYKGKKIKFINLYFYTDETYRLFPQLPRNSVYYYGGYLTYYGIFDYENFLKLSTVEKDNLLWRESFRFLQESAKSMKNNELSDASKYANKKGIELNFNRDYRMVECDATVFDVLVKASVWVNFKEDGMYSKMTLEKGDHVIFEKDIDKTQNGVEFFLEMYRNIKVVDNKIVIQGSRDVDYLPLTIPIDQNIVKA